MLFDVSAMTDAPATTPFIPSCCPADLKKKLFLIVVGRENSLLTIQIHDELMQSNLPLEVNSASAARDQEEIFETATAGEVLRFPHYETSYSDMLTALENHRDRDFFESRGDLEVLRRAMQLKHHPESYLDLDKFVPWDVVACFETAVYDMVLEHLSQQEACRQRPMSVLVLCFGTLDPKIFVDILEELLGDLAESDSHSKTAPQGPLPDTQPVIDYIIDPSRPKVWLETLDSKVLSISERVGVEILHCVWLYR